MNRRIIMVCVVASSIALSAAGRAADVLIEAESFSEHGVRFKIFAFWCVVVSWMKFHFSQNTRNERNFKKKGGVLGEYLFFLTINCK